MPNGDPAWEVQIALVSAVRTQADWVASWGGRFYDTVPQDTAFPYGCIGDETDNDNGTKDFSTEGDGRDMTWVLHFWSRYDGKKEVRQMMKAARDALHEITLPLSSNQTVSVRLEFQNTVTDADGKTQHGVQRYRVLTFGPSPVR